MDNNKKLLYLALRSLYYTIITDENGLIAFLSKNYEELLGLEEKDYIGKYVKDIIENSKIPRVLETKKAEFGELFTMKNGETVVCNRIPIFENDKLFGVISTASFYNLDEVSILQKQIEQLRNENIKYKKELHELRSKQSYSIDQVIGNSVKMMKVKKLVQKFADKNVTILITGETGTGKEVIANAIHKLSDRKDEKFVKINCAAIPKDLLESELFGYEPGSFSGASKNGKIGKFELANNGTLLLDEIGDMPLELQSKLLRVLQEGEIEKIGALKPIKVDVRVICSTNRNLEELVERKLFRRDLYYRINVVEIKLPPLRERMEDIVPLSEHFIEKINEFYGLHITGLKDDVYSLFAEYDWPGNVRELQHVLERGCIMAETGLLELKHFDFLLPKICRINDDKQKKKDSSSLYNITAEVEKSCIIKALIKANGNKTLAAKLLNIDRSSLYNKLRKYNIEY